MAEKLSRLIGIGFTCAGRWKLMDGVLALDLPHHANARNVLYAFVAEGQLVYIGKTVRSLSSRMAGYRAPGPSQSTNIKNHGNIRQCLGEAKQVEIYVLPDSGLLHYGGFHINLAAGLEDSLVHDLAPPWNAGQKEPAHEALGPTELW